MTLLNALLFSLLLLASSALAAEGCKNCKAISRAQYLGIKRVKEFLVKRDDTVKFRSEKKAKRSGYVKFSGCSRISIKPVKRKCSPVYAIPGQNVYLCLSELRPFKSEARARQAGYLPYTACNTQTPTPTPSPSPPPAATPVVTPLPTELNFVTESGNRLNGAAAISIVKLLSGNYRLYYSASVSPFDPDTLRYADSADGLTFGSAAAISGVSPDTLETFTFPAAIVTNSGSVVIVQDEIKHLSSGGLNITNLMRIEAGNGTSFNYNPAFVVIPSGSSLSHIFYPALLQEENSNLKLYYNTPSSMAVADSPDLGVNFGDSQEVTIQGRSETYAPFPSAPSVVRQATGRYLMFFSSTSGFDNEQSVYLASSTNGVTFHVFDQPLLEKGTDLSYEDPAAIVLPDNRIRVYYVERSGSGLGVTRTAKSIISD